MSAALRVVIAAGALIALASPAWARPGTHGPAISTFDTRASSLVLEAHYGLAPLGDLAHLSYFTNFTNTTGRLSSQFSLHYVSYLPHGLRSGHGISGGAMTLYNAPVLGRLDNGTPFLSLGVYAGVVPTVVMARPR